MINEVVTVDAAPAVAELDALATAAEEAAAKIDAAFKSIKTPSLGGSGAGNMARSMDAAAAKMQAAVDKMEASFAKLKDIGAEAGAAMGDIGKAGAESAAGLGDASKAANDAAESYARLGKASRDSAAMMDEQAVASKRAAKSSAESAAAGESFFSKHKELVLGTGLALGYAVDKAMKFQSQMTLLHTQAGVAQSGVDQLSTGVLKLAGATGQSPGNLAESIYHVASNMASMPGTTYAQMLKVTEMAARGASVGHANLVDTTNALTSVVASGIKGSKDYSSAMGMLNATVGSGDMSMQQLAESMASGLVPVVKGYGLTLKDVGAGLATFGDLNIRGAHAGTYLKMAVQALAVPMKTGPLKEFGLTMTTLSNDMQKGGLLKALDDLNGRFRKAGLTAQTEGPAITALFGKKAGAGLAVLMEQIDRFHSKFPLLQQDANNFGRAWQETLATPQQKLKNLEAGTQALAITAGNVLLPYANKALGGLDTGMQWLQSHALASKGLALGAGALVVGGITKGLFSGVESGLAGLGKIGSALKIPGLDKLANLGSTGASGSLAAVATSGDAAAAALGRLAGVASEESVIGAPGTIAGSRASAVVQEEESAAGLGGLLKGGAGGLMAGTMVAAIAIPLAMQADKLIQSHLGNTQASGYAQIGTGALAGAATGAAMGSVIPGLGTATGAIAGAIVGSLTTALKNPKVWDEIAGAPTKPGKPTIAPPKPQLWQMPGTPLPAPLVTQVVHPGKNPTIGWVAADMLDTKRHNISAGFDRARHDTAAAGDWIGGSYDTTRHQAAWFGQHLAELFGYQPPKTPPPAYTRPAPGELPQGMVPTAQWQKITGSTGYYASGQPFFGEVPRGVTQAPTISATPVAPGKLRALSQPAVQPIKIPPPDLSAVTAVKAKLTTDVSNVPVKPIKLPAPDTSALDSAKGKAQAAGNAITSAITGALGKPVHAKDPDLSAYASAAGKARAAGANISAGLAAGIRAGEGAAVAAAQAEAAAVTAALNISLQVRSPSRVTYRTGTEFSAGLERGIRDSTSKAATASKALSASAVSSLVTGLQGGQSAINAANTAIGKNAAKASDIASIDSTVAKLLADVPKGDTGLTRMLKADNASLDRMADTRAKLEAEIGNSEQLAKSMVSGASIMNALNATNPAGNEPLSAAGIIQGKQYQAQGMAQFAASLKQLQKMGLDATDLSQIAQAGPDQGLGIAQGIASGGKSAITQLNALQKQMQGSAARIGDVGGVAMYQAGQDALKGLASGLKADLGSLDKDMAKIANEMVTAVGKVAVKTKAAAAKATAGAASAAASPAAAASSSAPAAGSGSFGPAIASLSHAGAALSAAAAALDGAAAALKGDASGGPGGGSGGGTAVRARVPVAAHPVAHPAIASAPYGGGGGYGGGGYLPYGGGIGQHVHYHQGDTHVHVAGSVTTENDLLSALQERQLTRASNNWRGGWQLPGRSV